MPAQRLLQQPEGAVEVGELSARGRGRRCWGWAQGGVYREGGSAQAGPCLPHPTPRREAGVSDFRQRPCLYQAWCLAQMDPR